MREWSTLKKLIWLKGAKVIGAAGEVWKTISNAAIATFTAIVSPLRQLVVAIEPVQSGSGDPSPDNVRPISGWSEAKVWQTGKNLFEYKADGIEVGKRKNDSGSVVSDATGSFTNYLIPVCPGETFVVSGFSSSLSKRLYYLKSDGTFILRTPSFGGGYHFTAPADCQYIQLQSGNDETWSSVQIELGDTATAYEAYSGNTYTIDLSGTRYGGTLDVLTGVLTVDRAYLEFDGSADESWNTWSGNRAYYVRLSDIPAYPVASMICNSFKWKGRSNLSSGCVIGDFLANANAQGGNWNGNISFFYDDLAGGLANFKTWMGSNPIQIVYTLQTPLTVQLTAQQVSSLAGTNVLFADAGNVTVEYRES